MMYRGQRFLPIIVLSVLCGCVPGILTSSRHNTEEYSKAFAAASQGDLSELQTEVGRDHSLLRAAEWDGMTLLHDAVDKSQLTVVKYLLDQGANVAATTQDGRTPLHIAAQHGDVTAIKLLLQYGAPLNAKDQNGWTPLDRAEKWNHTGAADFLKLHGAQD